MASLALIVALAFLRGGADAQLHFDPALAPPPPPPPPPPLHFDFFDPLSPPTPPPLSPPLLLDPACSDGLPQACQAPWDDLFNQVK